MKIIDAHIHTHFEEEKGKVYCQQQGINFSLRGLRQELSKNKVEIAIAITSETKAPTPGEYSLLKKQCAEEPRLKAVCSINPIYTSAKYQKLVEQTLNGSIV